MTLDGRPDHTFIVIVIHELLGCDHVKKLQNAACLNLIGSLRSKTADGSDANIKVGNLGRANASLGNSQLLASDIHAVQGIESRRVGRDWVLVFSKCNALDIVRNYHNSYVVKNYSPWIPRCLCP